MDSVQSKRNVFAKCLEWHGEGQTEFEFHGRMYSWDGLLACRNALEELGGLMGEW